jgi:hypothetical protein
MENAASYIERRIEQKHLNWSWCVDKWIFVIQGFHLQKSDNMHEVAYFIGSLLKQ